MTAAIPSRIGMGVAPPGLCARWLVDGPCGKPATLHVLWDTDLNNGPVCLDHEHEALTRWTPIDSHPYGPACARSGDGAAWDKARGECVIPTVGFEPPGLGCARCGACCEDIWIPYETPDDLREKLASLGEDDVRSRADLTFMLDHWTPGRGPDRAVHWRWTCDQYDPEHRLCRAHDGRPPVCRDFPWYGQRPGDGGRIHTDCSYWLDVPAERRPHGSRPLIPVTVVTR